MIFKTNINLFIRTLLILISIFSFIVFSAFVIATPTGPSAIDITENNTSAATAAQMVNISGGIISKMNYCKTKVGSIYLSKNDEIGIFLKKRYHNMGIANKALELLVEKNPQERYLANVNPKNSNSIKFFKKNNFKLIQYTFELEKN